MAAVQTKRRFPIWQKILLMLILPIAFELAFVAVLAGLLHRTEAVYDEFERTKTLLVGFDAAERSIVISLLPVMKKDVSPPEVLRSVGAIASAIRGLQESIAVTANILPEVQQAIPDGVDVFDHAQQVLLKVGKIYADTSVPLEAKPAAFRRDTTLLLFELRPVFVQMHKISAKVDAMEPDELKRNLLLLSLAAPAWLLISLAVSFWVSTIFFSDIARRLEIIQSNANHLAMGKELLPRVSGSDEIEELDSAFHRAADLIANARRKESAILEKAADVLFSLDERYRIITVGDSAVKSWHYQIDELTGKAFLSLFAGPERSLASQALEYALQSEQEQEFEAPLKCGDTTEKCMRWKVSWHENSRSFNCVAHDISERLLLEKRKEKFIAIAGGELSTPLNSVSKILTLCATRKEGAAPDESSLKMINRAQGNLRRLTLLLDDLLSLEKMQSGKIVLNLSHTSADEICAAACAAVYALAQRAQVALKHSPGEYYMLADARRVEQVLVNFLSNAIKFSPKGATILVSTQPVPGFVELSVSDQGPGLEPADCELVFEKFYQAKTKSNVDMGSTGLGLAICKALAQAHQGAIGVESTVGQGSRFWIRIPSNCEEGSP